jgi:hypothetical protein
MTILALAFAAASIAGCIVLGVVVNHQRHAIDLINADYSYLHHRHHLLTSVLIDHICVDEWEYITFPDRRPRMTDQINILYSDFRRAARTLEDVSVPDGKEYGVVIKTTDGHVQFVLDSHGNLTITTETTNG